MTWINDKVSVFTSTDPEHADLIAVHVQGKSKRGGRRKFACTWLTQEEARSLIAKLERHMKP